MRTSIALGIYFITWWCVLFAILPFGVRSQEEAGDIVPGTERGAPMRPAILKKMLWTTLITTILFGLFYSLRRAGYGLDDIPFLPTYK